MATTAVESVIDVALWFMDRARRDDVYLQPQKLQRILYIAQGSFAAMHHGRKLMPAVFVAGETGPQDPNVFRLFERGRPSNVTADRILPEVENFLSVVWRRYGHHSTEYLNQQIQYHEIYRAAFRKGLGEEIPYLAIVKFFTRVERAPRPQMVKTADGRRLQKWMPSATPQARVRQ